MLSPGGTLLQEGAGSQNESWRSQEETWRLRFRITELLNSLEEKLLFRQLFQEETERKEKKKKQNGNCLEEKQYPHLEDSETNLEYSLQSENQSCRKESLTQEESKARKLSQELKQRQKKAICGENR